MTRPPGAAGTGSGVAALEQRQGSGQGERDEPGGDATEVDLLGRWASGGVFAGFVALALAAALTLFKRRDA